MHLFLVNGRRMCVIQNWRWLLATARETGSAAEKQRKRWAKFRDKIIFSSLILKFLLNIKQK